MYTILIFNTTVWRWYLCYCAISEFIIVTITQFLAVRRNDRSVQYLDLFNWISLWTCLQVSIRNIYCLKLMWSCIDKIMSNSVKYIETYFDWYLWVSKNREMSKKVLKSWEVIIDKTFEFPRKYDRYLNSSWVHHSKRSMRRGRLSLSGIVWPFFMALLGPLYLFQSRFEGAMYNKWVRRSSMTFR